MISEHYPSLECCGAKNLDKPHGWDTRVEEGSGVYLEAAPFNVPAERLQLLLEVRHAPTDADAGPGVIRTFVLSNPA